MAQEPKPFVRRDQALHDAAIFGAPRRPFPHGDRVEDIEQLPSDLNVTLIASLMETNQDLVRQAPL
jgi:hypothetical protein